MNVEHRPWTAWFGAEGITITALGGAGFSGSQVLLVTRPSGQRFVVKCFAPHVDAGRAAWIHAFMDHARGTGLETVPRVARRRRDSRTPGPCDTLFEDPAGRLWEVVEFLPGRSRTTPTDTEAAAALAGLARLHDAAGTLPGHPPRIEPAAGVARRAVGAARILDSPWHLLARATPGTAAVAARLEHAVDTFSSCQGRAALERISAVGPMPLTTQIVLRDVWSDHVLFRDDGRLVGFVDYHAVDRDTAAADLARLLGSWDAATAAGSLVDRWRHALDAYAAVRPLPARERRLIPWLHASGVICGLDNWFRWLLVDGRTFTDMVAVFARIDRLIAALPDALACARDATPVRD